MGPLTADLPLFDAVDGLSPLESLKALLAALPPPSRPALLQHILDALLSAVAGALPVQHLLSGETSTSDAARVIAGTARGAGWSLPLDLQTARELPNGVVRIRGMKDANVKEAALWCHARGLATSAERRWDAGGKSAPGKEVSSLEALTERECGVLLADIRIHRWSEYYAPRDCHDYYQDGGKANVHGRWQATLSSLRAVGSSYSHANSQPR